MDDGGRGVYNGMGRGEDGWGGMDEGMREEGAGEGDGFSLGDGDGGSGEKLWGS